MRVVFIGTSAFAIQSLKEIHYSCHKIVTIITRPDRPKGRGQKLTAPPIKKVAINLGYNVMQPNNINDIKVINKVKILNPDLFLVVAFGSILSEDLLKIPKKGAINVHPSLVPKYRGAAPIQWAIINGERETGVTTMLMDCGMDTGCKLLTKTTIIKSYETSACLHDRLSKIGSKLLLETISRINNDSLLPKKQDCNQATMAPMLKKKDGEINWNNSAEKIESFIRGMNPWPGAFTFYKDNRIKIIKATVIETSSKEPPGSILDSPPGSLYIAGSKNAISIKIIQGSSGKKLNINSFLCGKKFSKGSIFGSTRV